MLGATGCHNAHERAERSSLVPSQFVQTRCHRKRKREAHEAMSTAKSWLDDRDALQLWSWLGCMRYRLGQKSTANSTSRAGTDIHWQQDGAPNHRSKKDHELPHGPLIGEESSWHLGPPPVQTSMPLIGVCGGRSSKTSCQHRLLLICGQSCCA